MNLIEGAVIKNNGKTVRVKTKDGRIFKLPLYSVSKITANGKVYFELWKAQEIK